MDKHIEALHSAARRFCSEKHDHWTSEYSLLEKSGRWQVPTTDRFGWGYSREAYRIFPRYRLDEAIQTELEKLTGRDYPSLAAARQTFSEAAELALLKLLDEFKEPAAIESMEAEFKSFQQFVNAIPLTELDRLELLPYKRVLTEIESAEYWQKLTTRWKPANKGHYWYPLCDVPSYLDVVAFHQELWEERDGPTLLREFLQRNAISRCIVLREGPPDFEMEVSIVKPFYDGSESFITSDFSWLLYFSHESSITVAGSLADFYRSEWPDWKQREYGGPFHTEDLRGTWGSGS